MEHDWMVSYVYWHGIGMHDNSMLGGWWMIMVRSGRNSTKVSWWCLMV